MYSGILGNQPEEHEVEVPDSIFNPKPVKEKKSAKKDYFFQKV
jgi:hypothetical protein